MSGYCPECGNTLCICSEYEKATYPLRCEIKSLRKELDEARAVINAVGDVIRAGLPVSPTKDNHKKIMDFLIKYPNRATGAREAE